MLIHRVKLTEHACVEVLEELRQRAQLGVLAEQLSLRSSPIILLIILNYWDPVEVLGHFDPVLNVLERETFFDLHFAESRTTL